MLSSLFHDMGRFCQSARDKYNMLATDDTSPRYVSFGRGGAGNFVSTSSSARPPSRRQTSLTMLQVAINRTQPTTLTNCSHPESGRTRPICNHPSSRRLEIHSLGTKDSAAQTSFKRTIRYCSRLDDCYPSSGCPLPANVILPTPTQPR